MAELKGITAYVYETTVFGKRHRVGNGSMHLLGGKQRVTVVDDRIDPVSEASAADAPAVRLVRRVIGGKEVVHAVPVEAPPPGFHGPMMGGAYIATSDGRFSDAVGIYGAIPLHDRFEQAR